MLVNRAFGACPRWDFDFLRSQRSVMARDGVTQMTEAVRNVKRTLDVADVMSRGEEPAAFGVGNASPAESDA